MIIEHIKHITKYFNHVDALLFLSTENIIEYSAYFSRDENKFITDDFIGKNIFDIYPGLTPENSINCQVRRTGKPVLEMPITNCDYKNQVFHYISSTFPILIHGQIIGTLELSVYDDAKYISENKYAPSTLYKLHDFITQNEKIKQLKKRIAKIAVSDSAVLIYGETGNGKELIAQSICSHSGRVKKPFLSVNCSAIPPTLMESTLFGTMKGSFTGAVDQKGFFENAKGGTIFLDELNSMDIHLQAKLLRAIENKEIYRVGSSTPIASDVRIIAAMNEPPEQAIREKRLRSDLYYRLNVAQIMIPPLRERKDDIQALVPFFIDHFQKEKGKPITSVDQEVAGRFLEYDWPGNVRELKNVIEYAFLVCDETIIHSNDLPESFVVKPTHTALSAQSAMTAQSAITAQSTQKCLHNNLRLKDKVEAFEKSEIENALRLSRNLVKVSDFLGISRQLLQYKMKKYDLK